MAKKRNTIGIKPDEEWRVESDLRTLMEAKCIEKDPKRMAKCKAMAKEKMMEAAAVAGSDRDGE